MIYTDQFIKAFSDDERNHFRQMVSYRLDNAANYMLASQLKYDEKAFAFFIASGGISSSHKCGYSFLCIKQLADKPIDTDPNIGLKYVRMALGEVAIACAHAAYIDDESRGNLCLMSHWFQEMTKDYLFEQALDNYRKLEDWEDKPVYIAGYPIGMGHKTEQAASLCGRIIADVYIKERK